MATEWERVLESYYPPSAPRTKGSEPGDSFLKVVGTLGEPYKVNPMFARRPLPDQPTHGLCELCSSIDFRAIWDFNAEDHTHLDSDTIGSLWWTPPGHNRRLRDCNFCQTFYQQVSQAQYDDEKSGVRLHFNPHRKRNGLKGLAFYHDPIDFIIARQPSAPDLRTPQVFVYTHMGPDHPESASKTTTVDYQWLQAFLKVVKMSEADQNTYYTMPSRLKLLDVATAEVVNGPHAVDYLSLSYVWGRDARAAIGNNESQIVSGKRTMPRTITDALILTRKLGYRYLWVDRYCIDQHNAMEKAHQIGQMGRIYANATATIVGLGPDDSAALYGVTEPRQPSWVLPVPEGFLTHASRTLSEIRDSKWRTRGWTFQEAMLSRRLLIFTSQSTVISLAPAPHLQRDGALLIEPASFPRRRPPRSWTTAQDFSSTFNFGMSQYDIGLRACRPWASLSQYEHGNDFFWMRCLDEYYRRELTFERDALNAIQGCLMSSTTHFIWGVPIFTGITCKTAGGACPINSGLAAGLAWRTSISDTGCSGRDRSESPLIFPSWSWLSRRKAIRSAYNSLGQTVYIGSHVALRAPDGIVIECNQYLQHNRNDNACRQLVITGSLLQFNYRMKCVRGHARAHHKPTCRPTFPVLRGFPQPSPAWMGKMKGRSSLYAVVWGEENSTVTAHAIPLSASGETTSTEFRFMVEIHGS